MAKTIKYCPDCGSEMYDNRLAKQQGKYKPNAPDFKCPSCGKAIWLQSNKKKNNYQQRNNYTPKNIPEKTTVEKVPQSMYSAWAKDLAVVYLQANPPKNKKEVVEIFKYFLSAVKDSLNNSGQVENVKLPDIEPETQTNEVEEDVNIDDLDFGDLDNL